MLATVNKHSLLGFDELLFVWPLPFDLPGMGDPIKRFLSLASIARQVIETRKFSDHVKVVSSRESKFGMLKLYRGPVRALRRSGFRLRSAS